MIHLLIIITAVIIIIIFIAIIIIIIIHMISILNVISRFTIITIRIIMIIMMIAMSMMIIMIAMIIMSRCIIDSRRISLVFVLYHSFPSGIIDLRLLHSTVLIFTVTCMGPWATWAMLYDLFWSLGHCGSALGLFSTAAVLSLFLSLSDRRLEQNEKRKIRPTIICTTQQ